MKKDRLNSEPEVDILKHRCDMEVIESARAEEHLDWETRVDASRAVLHKVLTSPSTSIEEVASIILSRAQKLTGSQHGFVASLDPHVGSLIGYASTRMLESEYPLQGPNEKFVLSLGSDGHYPGLWGVSLNSGQAFYSNTPASHPAFTGLPDGHVPLERFLSLPVLIGSLVVGLIALSKAEKDYSDQDLAAIQPLADTLALVIQRSRYETALQKSDAFNQSIIDNSTDCIHVLDLEGRLQYMSQGGQKQMGIMDIAPYLTSPYENFWKNEDRQGVREAISKARQGETGTFQGFCPTLEGVPKWWDVVISPIRDHSGATEKLLVVSRDISKRKGMEEALQEVDRFNRTAMDALSAHLAILDENGFILTVNRAWRDFAQTNAGETTHLCEGINYLAICDAVKGKESEEAVLFAAGMRAVLQGKQDEFALEYPCHASHKKRWFMGRVTHFKSKGMIYLVIAHEDITKSKQADEILHQSLAQLEQRIGERTAQLASANHRLEDKIIEMEQSRNFSADLATKYRIVADNTNAWEFWLDPDGQFLYSSPSCQRITGYGTEDFLRDPTLLEQIIHPDDLPAWQMHRMETELENKLGQIELRIQRADGSTSWIEQVCQPVFDDLGQFVGTRGSHRDITERKRADDELKTILRTTIDSFYLIDMEGRILDTNASYCALIGYSHAELLTMQVKDIEAVDTDEVIKNRIQEILKTGYTRFETRHKTKDGRIIEIEASINYLIQDQPRFFCFMRDITERKQAEVKLVVANKELFFQNEEKEKRVAELAVANEKTVQSLQNIQALHNIDRAIADNLDLNLTLDIVLEQVKTQLKIDAAAVLLLNPYTQILEFTTGLGFRSKAIEGSRLRLGEGHSGRAALERRTVSVTDLLENSTQFDRATLLADEGFATYVVTPLIAKGQVNGVLEIYHRLPFAPDENWLKFFEILAGQAAIAVFSASLFIDLIKSNADLSAAYDSTIEGWSHAMDLRDKETEGHTQRVTAMSVQLAGAMGLGEVELLNIRRGALLHDMGKMGIPDAILLKPEPLTDAEWVIMRNHPVIARNLLSPIAYLHSAINIPYCHHEKWDGSGYPRGLKGEEIPLAARIFAIADVWDALTSNRPYRSAWSVERTRQHIQELSGKHFEPQIVVTFLGMIDESQNQRFTLILEV